MRDIRVTDDIFTGPLTDAELDDWVDLFDEEEWEHDAPDAIDRFIARRARDDAERAGGLPSAA